MGQWDAESGHFTYKLFRGTTFMNLGSKFFVNSIPKMV